MKLLPKLGALLALSGAAIPFGCSSDNAQIAPTGSGDGGPDASNPDATAPLKCGSTVCPTRMGIGIEQITQCCTDTNECGLKFPDATKCLPPDQPGVLSAACGDYAAKSKKTTLAGCCGPNGCGKNDAFLGCILNTDLGLPAQACSYDPTNNCQSIEDVPCDGPEDCPTGKHCCTDLGGGGPSKTKCYDSCVALLADASGGGTWRELCHAGDQCEDKTFQCRTSQFLPSWLTRCNVSGMGSLAPTNLDTSAGRVNCGAGVVCAAGQKCCDVQPASGQPFAYCADKNAECKCHPPDGGGPPPSGDAGNPPSDAGKDASKPPPSDAAKPPTDAAKPPTDAGNKG